MALEWKWDKKSGEITYNGHTFNFYKGNAFMIVLNEYKSEGKDMYDMAYFFVDKAHCKRCLGLEKGSYDMFEGLVEKIVIFMDNCPNWKDIVELFTKSQPNVVIELKPTEEKEAV